MSRENAEDDSGPSQSPSETTPKTVMNDVMVTIRCTPTERDALNREAKRVGAKSFQVWALPILLAALPKEGTIRISPALAAQYDIPEFPLYPPGAVEARQYQEGGQWYFHDAAGDLIARESAVWGDEYMQAMFADLRALEAVMKRIQSADLCPLCRAPEVDAATPRTVYACGSSDYDQRPGTFEMGNLCHLK